MDISGWKQTALLSFLVFGLLLGGCSAVKEPLSEEAWAEMEKLGNSRNFEFITSTVEPMGNMATTSDINFMRMWGDSIQMALPYAGTSSVAKFDNGRGGLRFTSTATRVRTARNEKQNSLDITFTTRYKAESFQCNLRIFSEGRASLGVNSSQRSFIQYEGLVRLLPNQH